MCKYHWVLNVFTFTRYLVLVLDERPQFALVLAGRLLLALLRVGQAGVGRRPLHRLAIVFELHIPRRLKARFIGLHNLFGVLVSGKVC